MNTQIISIKSLYYIVVCFIITSCSFKQKELEPTLLVEKLYSSSKVEFDKYFISTNGQNIFYLDKNRLSIESWSINKKSFHSEISLKPYFEKSFDHYKPISFRYKVCIKNKDSVYIIETDRHNKLHLITKKEDLITIDLDSIFSIYSSDRFYIGCRPNSRPIIQGNYLILNIMSYNVTSLISGNKDYFNTPKILRYHLTNGKSELLEIDFPDSYYNNYYHYMYSPLLAIKDSQSIFTAFSYANLVQEVNLNGQTRISQVKSSIPGDYIPFIADSFRNFNYMKNYHITAPENKNIYYSENRNHLYIIKEHQIPLQKNEFELNSEADKNWSVIVADSNLNKIHEFIFDKSDIRNESFFVDQNGFSLLNYDRSSSKDSISVWKYYYTYE